ncbi:DUF397 domain-containing protein [Streptomyces puniciscabiei]|uniref:DUF397 domain-containing protein n=1 Tax=Streptomyces puniciscabiei TaxID=164348 RepID=UPI00131BEBBB
MRRPTFPLPPKPSRDATHTGPVQLPHPLPQHGVRRRRLDRPRRTVPLPPAAEGTQLHPAAHAPHHLTGPPLRASTAYSHARFSAAAGREATLTLQRNPDGPKLAFPAEAWSAFVSGLKP